MSDEQQKLVIELTANSLFNLSSMRLDYTEEIIPELLLQAVLPIAIPTHKLASSIIASNMQVSYEHTELHNLLTQNSIPYVILKGVASASYYPNPILRTMGDVDFLINSADFPRVASLLESIGFEKATEDDGEGIHIAFHRDDSTWEMHR